MDRNYCQKNLYLFLLFFLLITMTTSFIHDEKEPITFIGGWFTYIGNKTNLFIICNSSSFNKGETYKFEFRPRPLSNYTSISYTYLNSPLKNLSYDYLNSLSYDLSSSTEQKQSICIDCTNVYYYDIVFQPKKNFEFLIFKIPMEKDSRSTFEIGSSFSIYNDWKSAITFILIIFFIFIVICIAMCVIGIILCVVGISKLKNKKNNIYPMPIQVPFYTQQGSPNVIYDNSQKYYNPNQVNIQENLYTNPGNQQNNY